MGGQLRCDLISQDMVETAININRPTTKLLLRLSRFSTGQIVRAVLAIVVVASIVTALFANALFPYFGSVPFLCLFAPTILAAGRKHWLAGLAHIVICLPLMYALFFGLYDFGYASNKFIDILIGTAVSGFIVIQLIPRTLSMIFLLYMEITTYSLEEISALCVIREVMRPQRTILQLSIARSLQDPGMC